MQKASRNDFVSSNLLKILSHKKTLTRFDNNIQLGYNKIQVNTTPKTVLINYKCIKVTIMITATLQNDYQVHFQSATHQWAADEPVAIGGQDSAPTPMRLLLSALAGCKAVTMKMYAQRKNWSVHQIEVRVRFTKRLLWRILVCRFLTT